MPRRAVGWWVVVLAGVVCCVVVTSVSTRGASTIVAGSDPIGPDGARPEPAATPEPVGPACTAPYPPVASSYAYVSTNIAGAPGTPVPVARLEMSSRLVPDGPEIESQPVSGRVVRAQLPGGPVRLTLGISPLWAVGAGDIDGDGVGEIWAMVTDPGRAVITDAYLVPSATPTGDHDVSVVGIRVPPVLILGSATWDSADGPQLISVDASPLSLAAGTTRLYSGDAILAAGPGGDARETAVQVEVAGVSAALIDFGGGVDLLTAEQDQSGASITVRLFDGRTTTGFTTMPAQYQPGSGTAANLVGATMFDGRRLIRVQNTNRGGSVAWIWSPDSPCEPLAVLAASAEAGPDGADSSPMPTGAGIRLTG